MKYEKQYVSRDITGFTTNLSDPFLYKTFSETGTEIFVPVLKEIMSKSLSRDDQMIHDADAELATLMKMAGEAFNPNCWLIATLNGETVGLTLPQQYPHKRERGSIFYIGILPKFRGHGYAQILHAKSLEVLAKIGVTEYVGSADVLNTPMIKVFTANGCKMNEIRTEDLPS